MNSGYGIENCTREKMTRLLLSNHISHPESLILRTDEDPTEALEKAGFFNCWIKRGDFHAIHRGKTSPNVRNPEEAKSILKEYAIRGIPSAVINEHLVGDLVKFYGVAGTDFFYWFYPSNMHHSKFGLEAINGTANGIPFDEAQLRLLCHKAAEVLNVHIYGEIVSSPRMVSCELSISTIGPVSPLAGEEAAPNIARRIWDLMREHI